MTSPHTDNRQASAAFRLLFLVPNQCAHWFYYNMTFRFFEGFAKMAHFIFFFFISRIVGVLAGWMNKNRCSGIEDATWMNANKREKAMSFRERTERVLISISMVFQCNCCAINECENCVRIFIIIFYLLPALASNWYFAQDWEKRGKFLVGIILITHWTGVCASVSVCAISSGLLNLIYSILNCLAS